MIWYAASTGPDQPLAIVAAPLRFLTAQGGLKPPAKEGQRANREDAGSGRQNALLSWASSVCATREIGSASDLWVHVGTIVLGETFGIMSRTRARLRREQPCASSLKPRRRLVGVWAVRITSSSSAAANRRCETPFLVSLRSLFEKWAVNKVPIGRYIAFVGSLLLAMLFIADWLLPMGPTQSVTSGEANKPIIGIKSDHKWPERIAFDTSAPTIVAQTPPVVADAPVTRPPREAFALLGGPVPEVSETPLPVRTKRKVAKRAPHSRWTAYQPAARAEALPAGW